MGDNGSELGTCICEKQTLYSEDIFGNFTEWLVEAE
jgi:hypothetical protein